MRTREPVFVRITQAHSDFDDLLRVGWQYDSWEGLMNAYYVSRRRLADAGQMVRDALRELVEHMLTHPNPEDLKVGALLWDIVTAGRALYVELFTQPEEGALPPGYEDRQGLNAQAAQERFEAELEHSQTNARIHFRVPGDLLVPFGLIFSPEDPVVPQGAFPTAFEDYNGFWCLKYAVSTTYSEFGPIISRLHAPETVLVSVFNEDERRNAETLTGAKWEPPCECNTKTGFRKAIQANRDRHKILYFYCHANGSMLSLGPQTQLHSISADDFRRSVALERRKVFGVAILNGCSTATGDAHGGWLAATAAGPFRGFIGTETVVPNLFAWNFGLALLRELLTVGGSVETVLLALRKEHWPLSLLYGVYCFPELQIEPGVEHHIPDIPRVNYSTQEIGMRGLE